MYGPQLPFGEPAGDITRGVFGEYVWVDTDLSGQPRGGGRPCLLGMVGGSMQIVILIEYAQHTINVRHCGEIFVHDGDQASVERNLLGMGEGIATHEACIDKLSMGEALRIGHASCRNRAIPHRDKVGRRRPHVAAASSGRMKPPRSE